MGIFPGYRRIKGIIGPILVAACIIFAVMHHMYKFVEFFHLVFGVLCVVSYSGQYILYRRTKNSEARSIVERQILLFIIAFSCWVIDYALCPIFRVIGINPQLHAWWHLIMGINSYYGPVF